MRRSPASGAKPRARSSSLACLRHPALLAVQDPQTAEDTDFQAPVARRHGDGLRLRQPGPGFVDAPGAPQRQGEGQGGRGAQRRIDLGQCKHLHPQGDAQGEGSMELEHFPGGAVGGDRNRPVASTRRPAAGGDQVLQLEREHPALLDAAVPEERLERVLRTEPGEVPAVPLFAARSAPGLLATSFSWAYSWMLMYIPKYGSSMS